ncbi:MAG: cob(I)yrinic acid a,c-diamide adenosyltransferase [Polyangia bacterium]|jgi:cob(I)alamin adenosyltransferase|nr:cob(I)yrinic acid a,c-diamide adenosyltransferase [Polyangia bacterium]
MTETHKSSIYTRGGDRGETSLLDGSRVPKDALRVEAYGTIDEANSWVGAALAFLEDPRLTEGLTFLQHRLYNCSSNVATPPGAGIQPTLVREEDVACLEEAIDFYDHASGPIRVFVLPGGCRAAGMLHVARTVCRRAERCLVALGAKEAVDPLVIRFVNRASDLLFAAARYANFLDGRGDLPWQKDLPLACFDPE